MSISEFNGWESRDWQTIENYSRNFLNIANDLDIDVAGGFGLTPEALLEIVIRTEAVTKRLRNIASSYQQTPKGG